MFVSLPRLPPPPLALALQQLPRMVNVTTRVIPFVVQRQCLLFVLQKMLKELISAGDLDFLAGRQLQIWISDANIRWSLGMQQGKLTLNPSGLADTTIRGKLADFILLASRQEDPDTLFFQRRLIIEGDTDLGHEMKNVLDTLDRDVLPTQLNVILDWLAQQYRHPESLSSA